MSLRDYHPQILEALAVHEALRRIGFSSDDIFFVYASQSGALQVLVRAQGREFAVNIGEPGELPEDAVGAVTRAWTSAVEEWNGGEDAEREAVWRGSKVSGRLIDLALALHSKGFRMDVSVGEVKIT